MYKSHAGTYMYMNCQMYHMLPGPLLHIITQINSSIHTIYMYAKLQISTMNGHAPIERQMHVVSIF